MSLLRSKVNSTIIVSVPKDEWYFKPNDQVIFQYADTYTPISTRYVGCVDTDSYGRIHAVCIFCDTKSGPFQKYSGCNEVQREILRMLGYGASVTTHPDFRILTFNEDSQIIINNIKIRDYKDRMFTLDQLLAQL